MGGGIVGENSFRLKGFSVDLPETSAGKINEF
jgi:hypothetical protein